MKLPPPLTLASPPDDAAWDALVAADPAATVFHTSAWARLWTAEWPGARWEALVAPAGEGVYAAGFGAIVRPGLLGPRVMSMPYATYGGPLLGTGAAAAGVRHSDLLAGYAALLRARRATRSELAWYDGDASAIPKGLEVEDLTTHVRPLTPDFDALFRALPHSVRSRVKQAEQQGLTRRIVTDEAGVAAFHALATSALERHGGTAKPLDLYLRILATLVPAGLARFDLAEDDGTPIAGGIHLLHRGVAINWLTVADPARLAARPNHFVLAGVLSDLCAAGFHEYNFGASPAGATGLVQFKEDWGATPRRVLRVRHRSLIQRLARN